MNEQEAMKRAVEEARAKRIERAKKMGLKKPVMACDSAEKVKNYWENSISGSIAKSVKNGNVKIIYC